MSKTGAMTLALASVLYLFLPQNTFAKDVSPFEIIKGYSVEKKSKNYIKLSSSLTEKEAMALDKAFSLQYGPAQIDRFGVKVWQIPNPNGKKSEARHITVTCGPEDDGFHISIDARGSGNGNAHLKLSHKQMSSSVQSPSSNFQKKNTLALVSKGSSKKSHRKHILKPNERD